MILFTLKNVLLMMVVRRGIANTSVDKNYIEALIEWVRSKGGFFSEKLEIRRMNPNDAQSPMGVYATQNIGIEESLLKVPPECYIGLWGDEIKRVDERRSHDEARWNVYWENLCLLSQKLLKEMRNDKNESQYTPYIEYLKTQKPGQLPAMWSEAGKDVIRKILGTGKSTSYGDYVLPPRDAVDWLHKHFVKTNCIRADDPFEAHVVEMTVQRGYDTAIIPLWDMVNHDNTRINTNNTPMYAEGGLHVWARKDIRAGEEIYGSYNECVDCGNTTDYWGTPEIFRDFGFLESYPQHWIFADHGIHFMVYLEDGELDAEFYDYGKPDEKGITFLREQYQRLEAMEKRDLVDRGMIPKHEWDAILQFYWNIRDAIDCALYTGTTAHEEL
mmetsp:Transcript_47906/g.57997  ORF Transcript_47906/g.57997 Transcript_47906/m.57997 type:complete len:386 (+) Transcript_47906:189-1346(+)